MYFGFFGVRGDFYMFIEKVYMWIRPEEKINVTKHMHYRVNDLHEHEFMELVYIFEGSGYQIIDGMPYPVIKGDMMFFNLGDNHMFIPDGKIGIFNILIDPDYIKNDNVLNGAVNRIFSHLSSAAYCQFPLTSFRIEDISEIEKLLDNMLVEFREKRQEYKETLKDYLHILLVKFLRNMEYNVYTGSNCNASFRIPPDIFNYIECNYHRKITLKELADYTYYNPSYFSTIFKECFGITVTNFMQIKRYKASLDYIINSDMPFDEIAIQVGFCDKKQFYKVFKELSNMSPNRYRYIYRRRILGTKVAE